MKSNKDKNGNVYEFAPNDSLGVRVYTLENKLKVYLAQNFDQPRIQTYIPVKTGSANDPKENTGLAHYLEHMLFKGTSKIGTKDWVQEKEILDQISELFEEHKAENNSDKKKEIYKKIDELSFKASEFAIANEYDKLISNLGGKSTNAYTSWDQTVYVNNIPSNEVEKWLKIESNRFSDLVLRLFHTELETVYEEFNRAQDNDYRLLYYNLLDGLFPAHPYGQQTTLGKAEHLKNPSMKAIHKYFSTYYVPNNMAIVMVGDLDFENTIELIKQNFGHYKFQELPQNNHPKEKNIYEIVEKQVFTPSTESLLMAFRTDGIKSKDKLKLELISQILFNGKAGIIDLEIAKKQKALQASCYLHNNIDYGWQQFYGIPKQGQTLEELRDLFLESIRKIKKGDFKPWMIEAAINDLELSRIKDFDSQNSLANYLVSSFIEDVSWSDLLDEINQMRKITDTDLIDFADNFYKNNYVIVYKKQGENKHLIKVENPKITPINIDRNSTSDFYKEIEKINPKEIQPLFINYKEKIKEEKINKLDFYSIENSKNKLSSLNYIIKKGSDHDRKFTLALNFLKYLGTENKSADQIAQDLYKLGIELNVKTFQDKSVISISGLSQNIPQGIILLEELFENVKANDLAYKDFVQTILKSRNDSKLNKNAIFNALQTYVIYGAKNRVTNIIPKQELENIKSEELVSIIKNAFNYNHEVFYYGNDSKNIKKIIKKEHNFGDNIPIENPTKYIENNTTGKVYAVNYDMVQVEIGMYSRNQIFDKELMTSSSILNEYFGSGLSSIVFQEIRESKSLAYSSYCIFANSLYKDSYNYTYAFLGTQANKLEQANNALRNLMKELPYSENQFETAKKSLKQSLASERITKEKIFWNYQTLKNRGLDYDIRQDIYNQIDSYDFSKLKLFFNTNISNKKYNYFLLSNLKSLDESVLNDLGELRILSIEDIFGY